MRVFRTRTPSEPPAAAAGPPTRPKQPWERLLEDEERPSRQDLEYGNHFAESLLEPVDMPRWMRGRRRRRKV
jgi:hypothetical protein